MIDMKQQNADLLDETKYDIYENDLKYRILRNIDPDKAEWTSENVQYKFKNVNCDSLKYRIRESEKSNFTYLDLSHLNLKSLPLLTNDKNYNKLKYIKYLFLNDNKLSDLDENICQFTNLEVLDISKNYLKHIAVLPFTLVELACHNNQLLSIVSHSRLRILDCSFNKLKSLGQYDSITKILCDNNELNSISSYNNLLYFICKQNSSLSTIGEQQKLTHIDCSYTKLSGKFTGCPNLTNLICNNTFMSSIDEKIDLKSLEIVNTNIRRLSYYPMLQDLIYSKSDDIDIDESYKIKQYYELDKNIYVEFLPR